MFDLYSLLIAFILIISFGLFGYLVKTRILKHLKINSYVVGMLSYFAIFELCSVIFIKLHVSFFIFKIFNVIVILILGIMSLHVYIKDYWKNKINHKYRFLKRYRKNKFIYQIMFLILVISALVLLFIPINLFKSDDINWIISIKDNITSSKLLLVEPQNGFQINEFQTYIFSSFTLLFSIITSILKINFISFSWISIKFIIIFMCLTVLKDFVMYFVKQKYQINIYYIILVILLICFANITNKDEQIFLIGNNSYIHYLTLVLIFSFILQIFEISSRKVCKNDYAFLLVLTFSTLMFSVFINIFIAIFLLFILITFIITKKWNKLLIISLYLILNATIIAISYYFFKNSNSKLFFETDFCQLNSCLNQNNLNKVYLQQNWIKWFTTSYLMWFILPLSICICYKEIDIKYKYLSWFLIFLTILTNPLIFELFKQNQLILLFTKISTVFMFVGYILYFPAINFVITNLKAKSDFIKLFQIFIFIYISMSTIKLETFNQVKNKVANTHFKYDKSYRDLIDSKYNNAEVEQADENNLLNEKQISYDNYYPIEISQVQTLNSLRTIYNGKYYVFSTSYQGINGKIRLFDSDARVITPDKYVSNTNNFSNKWSRCLNQSDYLSTNTLNACISVVNKEPKTLLILSNKFKNSFYNYVIKNFDKVYTNTKYTIYKKG